MTTLYRALWRDPRHDVLDRAQLLFERMVEQRYPGLAFDDAEHSRLVDDEFETTVLARAQRVTTADVDALDACLVERSAGEAWTTRLLSAIARDPSGAAERWVSVEVRRRSDAPYEHAPLEAPSVCRALLETRRGEPGPTLGGMRLRACVRSTGPMEAAGRALAELVSSGSREVPVAVFTGAGYDLDDVEHARAARAGVMLAGVADVVTVPRQAAAAFCESIARFGTSLEVSGGAARLYLPGRHPAARHRSLSRADLASATIDDDYPGSVFARVIAIGAATRTDPPPLAAARAAFRAVPAAPSDVSELEQRLLETEERARDLEDLVVDLTDDNERLGKAHSSLLGRLEHVETALAASSGRPPPARTISVPSPVPKPSEVPEFVRANLPKVILPDSACRDLHRLDDAISSEVWGRKAAEAFLAMQAYAERPRDFSGNFRDWARLSGDPRAAWPSRASTSTTAPAVRRDACTSASTGRTPWYPTRRAAERRSTSLRRPGRLACTAVRSCDVVDAGVASASRPPAARCGCNRGSASIRETHPWPTSS